MFIGTYSENGPLGFGERGRVGDDHWGGGVSLDLSVSQRAPSFDTTGRRATDRMLESGRHPQGRALVLDL